MTRAEFRTTPWEIGQSVKLTNGKTYKILPVIKNKGKRYSLTLYSAEYNAVFYADQRIIVGIHSKRRSKVTPKEKEALKKYLRDLYLKRKHYVEKRK